MKYSSETSMKSGRSSTTEKSTFFSDQKSREFHLQKFHIAAAPRLARLLIATCLAYLWIVYLGALCRQNGWINIIHRGDRCDLRLFQLGLRLRD